MDVRLQIHRYRLTPREGGGVAGVMRGGNDGRSGVLVRDLEHGGVGCIHSWPELGDATLEEELAALAGGRPLRLGMRALECAAVDGRARGAEVSLFEGMEIPPSHYHWRVGEDAGRQGEEVAAGGYPAVKLKLGGDRKDALARVALVADAVAVPMRLDFNASLTATGAGDFLRSLGNDLRRRIDLVEDPCPYDPEAWDSLNAETGIDLALDWGFSPEESGGWAGVSTVVFKPARDDGERLDKCGLPLLVTSYMDHPVGQMWAAWWAARMARGSLPGVLFRACGILTHGLFRGDPALDLVGQEGARLLAPVGTGLGFDDYLEEITWEDLG